MDSGLVMRPLGSRRLAGEIVLVCAAAALSLVATHRTGPATGAGTAVAWTGIVITTLVALRLHFSSGGEWPGLGLGPPRSWAATLATAVAAAAIMMPVGLALLRFVIEPLTSSGGPDLRRYSGEPMSVGGLAVAAIGIWTSAAICEEIVFRGYLLDRIARLAGTGRIALTTGIAVSSLLFGLMHLYQGTAGVLVTAFMGVLFGCLYIATGRNLWTVILTHGLIDSWSLATLFFVSRG